MFNTPDNPNRVNPPEEVFLTDEQNKHYDQMKEDLVESLLNRHHCDFVEFIDEMLADDSQRVSIMVRTLAESRDTPIAIQARDEAVASTLRSWMRSMTKRYLNYKEGNLELESLCHHLNITYWSER